MGGHKTRRAHLSLVAPAPPRAPSGAPAPVPRPAGPRPGRGPDGDAARAAPARRRLAAHADARRYVCPSCAKTFPVGGWQRQYDYDDHVAAHALRAAVRARLAALWCLPCATLRALWDRRARRTPARCDEGTTKPGGRGLR